MAFEDCPKFLEPRLRLFLSADIVGSTALKQSPFGTHALATQQRTSWFSKIQGFYFEAHKAFQAECDRQCEVQGEDALLGPPPELWKTIGDEVLFVKLLTDHRQLVVTLRCWMMAVARMRAFIKKDNSRLDVKCAAWLAGFPFRNSEVAVSAGRDIDVDGDGDWFIEGGKLLNRIYESDETVDAIVDYIGPSIDIGFRIASLATNRKFMLSVDVAYILALANPGNEIKDPVFNIYYDGSQILKGVLGGLRYLIFWIDLSPDDSIDRFEDNLTSLKSVNRDRLREYCNRFYEEHASYTFPPFIVSDMEQQISKRPEWYDDIHAKLVKNFKIESKADEDLAMSVSAEIQGPETNVVDAQKFIDEFLTEIRERYKDKGGPE